MTAPHLFVASLALAVAASAQTNLIGGWVGTFDRPGASRPTLQIEFANAPQGWVGSSESSVWASAVGLSSINIEGIQVSFEATTQSDLSQWVFRGNISSDQAAIQGTVTLGPDEWQFRLQRNDYALGLLAKSSQSLGEFDNGFAGRWYSDIPMTDGSRLRFVLRRTAYGFAADREIWGHGERLHKINIVEASIRFELPRKASRFA